MGLNSHCLTLIHPPSEVCVCACVSLCVFIIIFSLVSSLSVCFSSKHVQKEHAHIYTHLLQPLTHNITRTHVYITYTHTRTGGDCTLRSK